MKKLMIIVFILSIAAFSTLSAVLTPDSPEYDAWKRAQYNSSEIPQKPDTNPMVRTYGGPDQLPGDLLIPLDGTFTLAMAPNDDYYSDTITLPFIFSLYGQPYNTCWINNNGNVSFNGGYSTYTPFGFPITDYPILAPFFADVDTRGTGSVWYKLEPNRMIVIWDHVGYYNSQTDKVNTFELIFTNGTDPTIGLGNTVAFSYGDMGWTTGSASGGDGGFLGTPATVGINKGDGVLFAQTGRFDHPGTDYDGAEGLADGVDWLDDQIFYYDTGTAATMSIVPTTYDTVLFGIDPPAGALPGDPNTTVYIASYPDAGNQTVQIPVGEGTWRGWIYYTFAWHQADVFPLIGPGTIVFSNVPFGAKFDVPFMLTLEEPTLPVELSNIYAVQTAENFVKLTWVSESETNLLGYRVYRALDDSYAASTLITPELIWPTNTSTQHVYSITDAEVETGNTYYYWLESVEYNHTDLHGPVVINVVNNEVPELPGFTALGSAYPNPFKASTSFSVDVKAGENAKVTIYNILGQAVRTFNCNPGTQTITWDAKDYNNNDCGSGIYFYRLSSPSLNQTRKMMVVK